MPDIEAAKALPEIRKRCPDSILVSDIHFQYKFALMALDAGIDKLRINPGNIGDAEKVRMVVRRAQEQKVPIRIGVNAGSLERRLLEKYGYPTPEAMVESALYHIQILEDLGFTDTIISLKASNVKLCVSPPIACLPGRWIIPCTWALRRPARSFPAPSSPAWAWGCCWRKASATPSAFRWPPIRWKKCAWLRAAQVAGIAQPRAGGDCLPHLRAAGS